MWKRGAGIKTDYTTPNIYKFYQNTSKNPYISLAQFTEICREFNLGLIDEIYKGFVFRIPANLGYLGITKSVSKAVFDDKGEVDIYKSTVSVDWGTTLKLWESNPSLTKKKYVYHDNLHTNGIRYKIKWKKNYFTNKALRHYKFTPVRTFKRGLTVYIKNTKNIEYYEF